MACKHEKASVICFNDFYFTIFLLIISVVFYHLTKRRKSLPPGPFPYPLIGNVLQVGSKPHLRFMQWAEKYGPVMHLKMGFQDVVVLSGSKTIKEMLSHPATGGREVENAVSFEYSKGSYGILNTEGETSEAQRRFTLRTLKDLGFAKSVMEGMIMEDVCVTMSWLKERQNTELLGNRLFNAPVGNTLWNIVSGKRLEWESGKSEFVNRGDALIKSFSEVTGNGLLYCPILRHVFPELMGWNRWVKSIKQMYEFSGISVEEHKSSFNKEELKDYIDYYLNEIDATHEANSSFYKDKGVKNLIMSVMDLFLGGSETTATSLSWALLYLSQHQDIQTKVHAQIDEIVGSSNSPTLSDRSKMPYVEAVLLEILRISSVLPLGLIHTVISDFTFGDYTLEKNTWILANLYGTHHGPVWGDPDTFRPERFLNDDGSKVVKHEEFVPFSEGKRKCIGETLARDSLFLYFTSVFQQFEVLPSCEKGYTPSFEAEGKGLVLAPKPFKIVLKPRVA